MKYGYEEDVQLLLDQFDNFVVKNDIVREFDRAFTDMRNVTEEYKKDAKIGRRDLQFFTVFEGDWLILGRKVAREKIIWPFFDAIFSFFTGKLLA